VPNGMVKAPANNLQQPASFSEVKPNTSLGVHYFFGKQFHHGKHITASLSAAIVHSSCNSTLGRGWHKTKM